MIPIVYYTMKSFVDPPVFYLVIEYVLHFVIDRLLGGFRDTVRVITKYIVVFVRDAYVCPIKKYVNRTRSI